MLHVRSFIHSLSLFTGAAVPVPVSDPGPGLGPGYGPGPGPGSSPAFDPGPANTAYVIQFSLEAVSDRCSCSRELTWPAVCLLCVMCVRVAVSCPLLFVLASQQSVSHYC